MVKTFRIPHEMLSHATEWNCVIRNVTEGVDPPRVTRHEMHTLDADGVQQLLRIFRDSNLYPIIHLAVYTGMRRSELLGLRWRDVDLDRATIHVVQSLHQLREQRQREDE